MRSDKDNKQERARVHIVDAKYIGSFPNNRTCPDSNLPEYAFIGRSNVGKSSLINALTGRKDLARTSKSPGKTRSINLFNIDLTWQIADLPGYGYAKVSKSERKRWQKMIEDYMLMRENLATAFILVDLRHDLQTIDLDFINWMGERRVPFAILFTKADKIKDAHVGRHIASIESSLAEFWEEMPPRIVTSSVDERGRGDLLDYISEINQRLTAE